MNTTVLIPTHIQNTAPKPTKSQIIEALMNRARKTHGQAETLKASKRDQLETEGIALVLEAFKKAKPTKEDVSLAHSWKWDRPATVEVKVNSPAIRAIQKKINNLSSSRFDEDETKKKIQEGMKAPNPLLGNDAAEAALDQLLATIMNTPRVIDQTIDV